MQLGDLDRRIVIEQYTTTTDAYGQRVESWTTFATVWAKIMYEGGGEDFEAEQKTANRIVKFLIRYASVTEKMRVSYASAYYDIENIEEVGRKNYLVLRCKKNDKT
jgi:SPP1 family predicted phage head-tail adaptor